MSSTDFPVIHRHNISAMNSIRPHSRLVVRVPSAEQWGDADESGGEVVPDDATRLRPRPLYRRGEERLRGRRARPTTGHQVRSASSRMDGAALHAHLWLLSRLVFTANFHLSSASRSLHQRFSEASTSSNGSSGLPPRANSRRSITTRSITSDELDNPLINNAQQPSPPQLPSAEQQPPM